MFLKHFLQGCSSAASLLDSFVFLLNFIPFFRVAYYLLFAGLQSVCFIYAASLNIVYFPPMIDYSNCCNLILMFLYLSSMSYLHELR